MEDELQVETNKKGRLANMDIILKELWDFTKDSNEQFNALREELNRIGKRLDDVEEQTDGRGDSGSAI